MRTFRFTAFLVLSGAVGCAFAQSPAVPPAATQAQALSPAQVDAAQLVDAFAAALIAGQFDAARQFMAPDAVVVANGKVLGDRDGYIDGAAHGDAAALRTVQRELLRREVSAGPDFGFVVSEKQLRTPGDAKARGEVVIETILIARMPTGWKITHIHWSGRHAG